MKINTWPGIDKMKIHTWLGIAKMDEYFVIRKKRLKITNIIKSHKSNQDRQYNGKKKKYKRTNNDLQNTTQKTKDWATRISPKKNPGVNSRRVSDSCSTSGNRLFIYYDYSKIFSLDAQQGTSGVCIRLEP